VSVVLLACGGPRGKREAAETPGAASAPGDHTGKLGDREYLVHVPRSYDASKPTPLVLDFHGLTANAVVQALYSKMTVKADAAGFIAVHPQGVGSSWNAGICCGAAADRKVDDVAFVRGLLDQLSKELNVDPKRIYATGISNGAMFSQRLACELSDRIAAVGTVAGIYVTAKCTPARPVPVIHFHGTDDKLASYKLPDVPQSLAAWAALDKCGATPHETLRHGDARCEAWEGCGHHAEVVLCTIEGGGHTWPGGASDFPPMGKTSHDIDATDAFWDFFVKHPMP
jgi:polyhydroxybutyrate depolymerase